MSNIKNKPWSGRFTESTDAFVEEFTASVTFDQRLYAQDIQGSQAHARMLAKINMLTSDECEAIVTALDEIKNEIEAGEFDWRVDLEDVHMNIESRLVEKIGEPGKKLHTGRSRNDQVATDIRLYLLEQIDLIDAEMQRMQYAILNLAEQEIDTLMPGFTHLQVAQVITVGHHLMAWFEMISRDRGRLADCKKRVNIMPLGSAALAGTAFPLDRQFVAEQLGFDFVSNNSLDAVSDRDFAIEFCSFASILLMHLSRMSEELVLWASQQFEFIELPDSFCTGSSIMPQKKNPDVPELVRGKSGRVFGNLMSMLTLMKSQVLAYNKDNQEDKEPLFDTIDTVRGSVRVFADMIPSLVFKRDNLAQAVNKGYATATDLADYLVSKDIAFRDAHEVVGQAVRMAIDENKELTQLSLEQYQSLCEVITEEVFIVLQTKGSVESKNIVGGTSPQQVKQQIVQARKAIKN
ncbi:MAG: argininosuccinate lyase [Pseudomonadota bacterium]